MQGLQVPTWLGVVLLLSVPIGTAFGAIFGQWLGQRTAAKRDDARWERERDREDVRYAREVERARMQREVDIGLAWRSERLASYANLLESFNTWSKLIFLIDFADPANYEYLITNSQEFTTSRQACSRAAESLELIGSSEVRRRLEDLMESVRNLTDEILRAQLLKQPLRARSLTGISLLEMNAMRDRVRDAARADVLADPVSQ